MKLILLELNELNFDVVNDYIDRGVVLPGFERLMQLGVSITRAENEYENLEPWIQWPSVHTGKTFQEHKIFRLGDFVNSSDEQFFEKVEKAGFTVGAISPMNASNKLKAPAFFIPDPWTQTPCDRSFISKTLTDALVQAVNDNSQARLTLKTIFNLTLAFIALVRPSRYFSLITYAAKALGKPWRRALFLDMLLYEIYRKLSRDGNTHFSTLFLNAGAHVQHHYFFCSPYVRLPYLKNPDWYVRETEDPILEMLQVYDEMLLDLLAVPNLDVIVATGLSQRPYERLTFYYRLKNHADFLDKIEVEFLNVMPRMTRDFLVSFETTELAARAERILSSVLVDRRLPLFEEIDNRGRELFVVLTYPAEITTETTISCSELEMPLIDLVTFVAIKNGEHQSRGFAVFSEGVREFAPPAGSHVSSINATILDYFGIRD